MSRSEKKILIDLARERFHRQVPTVELMKRQRSRAAKRLVATVAMLDVPREALERMLAACPGELARTLADRRQLVRQLTEEGILVPQAA